MCFFKDLNMVVVGAPRTAGSSLALECRAASFKKCGSIRLGQVGWFNGAYDDFGRRDKTAAGAYERVVVRVSR